MPRDKKKKEEESDSSSDSGPDDIEPPKKKTKSGASRMEGEDEPTWALEKNRLVKVREFKGKVYIDIREFYEKDGKMLPGKKGISLPVNQWNMLKEIMDEIDEEVQKK